MSLTESLRILITANGAQAEREFTKTGAAARAGLGQAETATQQFGRSLTSAGVAMATFGGVALFGLYKAAQAADAENQAVTKLNNSIANSPALVGASNQAFLDQAAALQDVTTFADEVTISSQAMLATFRLTEDEILTLTPLVADVAAKFDVDMVRAATNVGKAMLGNIGALQRWGVNIDEAAFETDRFGAVVAALEENAGGAAEALGGTFSGQLEILKNNLGDIAEGIGQGAISAFNDMLGPVQSLSDAFTSLDPEVQSTVGRIAAFGSAGLIAAGGISFLAGQVFTAIDRFKKMQTAAAGAFAVMRIGGIAAAGSALGVIGIAATTAALAFDVFGDSSEEVQTDVEALSRALREQQGLTGTLSQQWLVDFFASGEDGAAELLSALNEAGIGIQELDGILAMSLEEFNAWKAALQEETDFQIFDGDDLFTLGSLREDREQAFELAEGIDEIGGAASDSQDAISDLSAEIDNFLDRTLGIGQAQDATATAFNNLYEQLLSGPRAFEGNTQAAIDNRAALDGVVEAVANEIDVLQQQGRGEQAFQNAKQRSIERIREAARLHLIEEGAARRAIAAIRAIPPRAPFELEMSADNSRALTAIQSVYEAAQDAARAVGQIGGSLAGGGTYRPPAGGGGGGTGDEERSRPSSSAELARELARTPLLVKVID